MVKLLNAELWSLAGLLSLALLATFSPGFHSWCVLDRDALAAGEVWRLWTGHLAHFSTSHLLVDALVFALLAGALRRAGECAPGRVLFTSGALLSVSLLACDAQLARYGGLSGLNSLLLGRLVVLWFQAGGRQRMTGLGLLAVAVGKFTLDSAGLTGPGVEFDSAAIAPSNLSHWLGLGWGLVLPETPEPERCCWRDRSAAFRPQKRPPQPGLAFAPAPASSRTVWFAHTDSPEIR
ncbi:MAG: rhomboid family intramembrane serine protease [Limisphaerales bacterium]